METETITREVDVLEVLELLEHELEILGMLVTYSVFAEVEDF